MVGVTLRYSNMAALEFPYKWRRSWEYHQTQWRISQLAMLDDQRVLLIGGYPG